MLFQSEEPALRCVIIALICIWKKALFFIENPSSSLIWAHERFQMLTTKHPIFKVLVYMGAYGGPTLKPCYIWCNSERVSSLYKPAPCMKVLETEQVAVKFIDGSGKRRCTGVADKLKQSQPLPQTLLCVPLGMGTYFVFLMKQCH
jgi:hypothetical protein